jgi:uncharacterized membrane protein
MERPDFAKYLYKTFYQIRYYGKDDISILSSIIQSLTLTASNNDNELNYPPLIDLAV